jgi:pimeloyl-ACP methyl ester carboxylesterase
VIATLRRAGIEALAVATPLVGLRSDAAYVASLAQAVGGPVVLAGHGTGGAVIAAAAAKNVTGVVYIAALTPAAGERGGNLLSAAALEALRPATIGTSVELTLRRDRYRELVAGDLPHEDALVMAATQRPIQAAALDEPAPAPAPVPAWFVVATRDRLLAPRARAAGEVVELAASHAVPRSRPAEVAEVIERAARR